MRAYYLVKGGGDVAIHHMVIGILVPSLVLTILLALGVVNKGLTPLTYRATPTFLWTSLFLLFSLRIFTNMG